MLFISLSGSVGPISLSSGGTTVCGVQCDGVVKCEGTCASGSFQVDHDCNNDGVCTLTCTGDDGNLTKV